MKMRFFKSIIILTIGLAGQVAFSQNAPSDVVAGIPVNYDESKVETYTLPDPLLLLNGKQVKNSKTWYRQRRPEILKLVEEYQYGKCPAPPKDMTFNVFDKGSPVFDGKAMRRQVTIYFTKDTSDFKMELLIYLPANSNKPVPVFLNISFSANSNITEDPGIKQGMIWGRDGKRVPAPQGGRFGRMDIDQFISQGIIINTGKIPMISLSMQI